MTDMLIPNRPQKGKNIDEILAGMPKEGEVQPEVTPAEGTIIGSPDFRIEELDDFYRISGVQFRNDIYVVDFANRLLEKGKNNTQDQWVDYSIEAVRRNGFGVVSAPMHHSIFKILHQYRDDAQHKDLIEKIQTFVSGTFHHWVCTLSSVEYNPSGIDKVIHNFGMYGEYAVDEVMAGPDGYITDISEGSQYCKALVGSDDIQDVNAIYKWITGKDSYAFRLNSKPVKKEKLAVAFFIDYTRFDFSTYLEDKGPALGMRWKKIQTGASQ